MKTMREEDNQSIDALVRNYSAMNVSTLQELHSMYGNRFPSHGQSLLAINPHHDFNRVRGAVEDSHDRSAAYDQVLAKYSKTVDAPPSNSNLNTNAAFLDTISYGDLRGVETISFENFVGQKSETKNTGAMNSLGHTTACFEEKPILGTSASMETDVLIGRANANRVSLDSSILGETSFYGIKEGKAFTSKINHTTMVNDNAFNPMYHPQAQAGLTSNITSSANTNSFKVNDSSERVEIYDESDKAQRLLDSSKKFEESLNRVTLDPPEIYDVPQVRNFRSSMSPTGYHAPLVYDTRLSNSKYNGHSTNSFNDFVPSKGDSIHTTLQMLNAKSRAFKAFLEQNSARPVSDTSPAANFSNSTLDKRYHCDEIDARLAALKDQCSAMKAATSLQSVEKKESFSSHAAYNTQHINIKAPFSDKKSDFQGPTALDSKISINPERKSMDSAKTSKSIFSSSAARTINPIALKILSEKVLCGYRMTREHCMRCGLCKLSENEKSSVGSSTVFQRVECAFCPINDLRSLIQSDVSKKVMASKILLGSSALSRGKLCELCYSPTFSQQDGTVVCEVCPVLDAICIQTVREQGRGGKLHEVLLCKNCGAKQMLTVNGNLTCVCCVVMNEWQQQLEQQLQDQKENHEQANQQQQLERQQHTAEPLAKEEQKSATTCVKADPSFSEELKEHFSSATGKDVEANHAPEAGVIAKEKDRSKLCESLMGPCGVLSSSPSTKEASLSIANLQSQLLQELAKAKQSQLVLENTLESTSVISASKPPPEELTEKLAKSKRCQYALERIIETTSNIERFPSVSPCDPEIEDMMSAPELRGSFSISQQEVEAGIVKEYIPPRSFFRSGIPSVVEITLISPAPESNLAQSNHTKNLKNTDNDKKLISKSRVGIDFWPFNTGDDQANRREEEQAAFDYDTIQTDDFTVDYTLNTVDDSKLEYLHIKSRNPRVRFQIDEENESPGGCCILQCFGCVGGEVLHEQRQDATVPRDNEEDNRQERSLAQPQHHWRNANLENRENETDVKTEQNDERSDYGSISQHVSSYSCGSRQNVTQAKKNVLSNNSYTSDVSSYTHQKQGPESIGGGDGRLASKWNNMQQFKTPKIPSQSDYSIISDFSGHTRPVSRTLSHINGSNSQRASIVPLMNTIPSDYSAVSDMSGSMNRMSERRGSFRANSPSDVSIYSDNSGSMAQLGRRLSIPTLRTPQSEGRRSKKVLLNPSGNVFKMGVLPEDESVDTSHEKYNVSAAHIPSRAENKFHSHRKKQNAVREFKRSHPPVLMT